MLRNPTLVRAVFHSLMMTARVPPSWCYRTDLLCNGSIKIVGTFNLFPCETKVIVLLLCHKPVQTGVSTEGQTKPLLVWIYFTACVAVKGHLAQESKGKVQPGVAQNSETSIQVNSLYHENQRWKKSLMTELVSPATVHVQQYELGFPFWSLTPMHSILGPLEHMKISLAMNDTPENCSAALESVIGQMLPR